MGMRRSESGSDPERPTQIGSRKQKIGTRGQAAARDSRLADFP
jgi:hypothetical protein